MTQHHASLWALSLVGLFALAACGDPLIGKWQGTEPDGCNDASEFEVTEGDDGLEGDGTAVFSFPDCLECKFEIVEIEDKDDGKYEGKVEFDTCACGDEKEFDVECDLSDDETEADCQIDLGACGEWEDEFDKEEE